MTDTHPGRKALHLVTILYNSADSLPLFMGCLIAQDMPGWRLHVIDNASADGSARIVEQRSDARISVLKNAVNLGFAKAANQGLRAAAGEGCELVVLLNNDTSFGPDFLRRLAAVHDRLGESAFSPRVMLMERPDEPWYAGGSIDRGWVFRSLHRRDHDPSQGDAPTAVEFASGCCLAISRSVLERAGLFDESFFVYWEDTDFCMRLTQLGIPIWYSPEPSLLHAGAASSGGEWSPGYIRLYYRSYMQIVRKHFGARRALATMLRLLLLENSQKRRDGRKMATMAWAMLLGLKAPLLPPARLDSRDARAAM